MHAFILAGGFATRLWPLTEKRAKPLLPLAGIPLIEYLVRDIPEDVPVTISTNATFKEAFEDWAEGFGRSNVEILIEDVKSDDQKLGALGATAQWITDAQIDDDVLLLTGDNYCGFSFDAFLKAATPDTTLIAVHDIGDLEKAKAFGTVIVENAQRVSAFEEKPKSPKTTLVNTGCSLLPKSTLPFLVEYAKEHPDNVGGIFEELLHKGKQIECFRFTEPWFDIGSFDAYIEATKELVGGAVITEEGARFERSKHNGSVVIGSQSQVIDSDLTDVVIFENCVIEDCVLSNCVLDKGCKLKGIDLTGKMLREGTILT
ncbi:MAG: NDP-sugar synthase [bacterium]|nr:NDP-sugar synthase [bacterium]MDA1292981.1 NDP-sugar synthase [bacterium]